MTDLTLTVADDLIDVVRLGALQFEGLSVRATADTAALAEGDPTVAPDAEARVALVRAMYRQCGIDPTRTRPSSEALARRVRRGLSWPRINTLVDACNRGSLETQLPFGVYDIDHVSGAIALRRGATRDEYEGIGKPVVHLSGRPALYDAAGPFGNPTSDSARTMITPDTVRALLVVYAPRPVPAAELNAVLDLSAARALQTSGGMEAGRWIIPSG